MSMFSIYVRNSGSPSNVVFHNNLAIIAALAGIKTI